MSEKSAVFEFHWKIENFSYCLPWMKLKSPSFVVDSWEKTRWFLHIIFRGDLDPISVSFKLCREADEIPLIIDLKYELSFLGKDGEPFASKTSKWLFSPGDMDGFGKFLELSDILGSKKDERLSEGTLTACCVMKRLEDDGSEYTRCLGRSRLGLERSSFLWLVNEFSALRPGKKKTLLVKTTSMNISSLSMTLFLDEDGDSIRIQIAEDDDCESNMFRCEISLVDSEENVAFSKQDTHWFKSGKKDRQVWDFPVFLRKSKLAAKEKLYLPNDTLKLRCEWKIDSGIIYSRIESCRKYLFSELQSIMITMESANYDE